MIERPGTAAAPETAREARRAENGRRARASGDRRVALACECRDDECEATLDLPAGRYLRAAWGGRRFVVRPGHERDGEDVVVESHRRWSVVGAPPSELFLG